jgi:hypothetical protein
MEWTRRLQYCVTIKKSRCSTSNLSDHARLASKSITYTCEIASRRGRRVVHSHSLHTEPNQDMTQHCTFDEGSAVVSGVPSVAIPLTCGGRGETVT